MPYCSVTEVGLALYATRASLAYLLHNIESSMFYVLYVDCACVCLCVCVCVCVCVCMRVQNLAVQFRLLYRINSLRLPDSAVVT